jgi:hypothetical protein
VKPSTKKEIEARVVAAIKEAAVDVKEHFRPRNKNGGWPLLVEFYVSDITYQVLGFDLYARLLQELNKKVGIKLSLEDTRGTTMSLDKKSTRKGFPRMEFNKSKKSAAAPKKRKGKAKRNASR